MKQPHYTCIVCGDGKYRIGGFAQAGQHSRTQHPDTQFDVRITMRYPKRRFFNGPSKQF